MALIGGKMPDKMSSALCGAGVSRLKCASIYDVGGGSCTGQYHFAEHQIQVKGKCPRDLNRNQKEI